MPHKVEEALPKELVVQHIAGALFGLLVWWVDHDFPHSEEQMGDAAQLLVIGGLTGSGFCLG